MFPSDDRCPYLSERAGRAQCGKKEVESFRRLVEGNIDNYGNTGIDSTDIQSLLCNSSGYKRCKVYQQHLE